MAKKIKAQVKILIKAGAANPAPPIGSTLGPFGINLMEFCKQFNEKTKSDVGMIPVEVTVFEDRSFEFLIKTPPVAELVKQLAGIVSGSGNPLKEKVGTLTMDKIKEIAERKMPDLNCYDLEAAIAMVLGTCKSMGVTVTA
jgi:large subunit ribosomal protein L11